MPQDQPEIVDNPLKCITKQLPVTCIKFFEALVIGAIGGDLHVYKSGNESYRHYKRISLINVFPSESIYGISINDLKIIVFGGKKVALLERSENFTRISVSSCWNVEDWILDCVWIGDFEIALLTAHNVLLFYQCSPPPSIISRTKCAERSILYSGKILNSKCDEFVVLSGTVYQEVIIWTFEKSVLEDCQVIHRLKGHKGVIFSISYDEKTQRICSTSDDRTVRVWSVTFPDNEIGNWKAAEIVFCFSVYGHTARVWRSLFIPGEQLISIGEDSQICLWSKNGKLLSRWEHNGDIWCLDYNDREHQIAVGGNGIVIRSILPLPEIPSFKLSEDCGIMRNTVMSYNGNKIIITDKGKLILYGNDVVDEIDDERFISYCILSLSPSRKYVALGGIHGDIVIYKVLEKRFVVLCNVDIKCRVFALCWASDDTIVSNGIDGLLSVWKLSLCETATKDNGSIQRQSDYILPPSKERWITCASLVGHHLICGDRMGSVHLFSMSNKEMDPVDSLKKLHDIRGVSDIKQIDGTTYSTGRDGTLRELTILDGKLVLLSTLKLPMDWATSILKTDVYGLIIMGFYGSNFMLWNVEERMVLLQLDCGGGHRSFDCILDFERGNLVINYLRMKEMKFLLCPLNKVSYQTVLAGYHKKTINCSCLLSSEGETACILTGSEDNTVRLCVLDGSEWKNCLTYSRHISSVRAAAVLDDVVATAGGRAQIILWHIQRHSGEIRLKEVDSHMLREESEHHRSWRNAKPLIDPETRYMDLKIVKRKDGSYTIFCCCSDGMLRIFSHSKNKPKLLLIDSFDSNQGCLFKMSVFECDDEPVVITGGANGSVSFWYPPFDSPPNSGHSLHSLGISSMDSMINKKHLILCTGGDDTSVVLCAFSLTKGKKEQLVFSLREHLHYCQVTGVKMTSDYIVSIGLDQKLFLIHWEFDGNYFKTSLHFKFCISTLDNHGLLLWPLEKKDEMKIFIFGNGFEAIDFNRLLVTKSK